MDEELNRKILKDLEGLRKQIDNKIRETKNEPPEIQKMRQRLLESYKHHIAPVGKMIKLRKMLGESITKISDEATKQIAEGILQQINAFVESELQHDMTVDESIDADDPKTYKQYQITSICYVMIKTLRKIGVDIPSRFPEYLNQDLHDMAFPEKEEEEVEEFKQSFELGLPQSRRCNRG